MYKRLARLLVCGCLLLAGQVSGATDLSALEVGMSREQVFSLLGEPRGRAYDGRREVLFYGVEQEVHLEDGAVYMVTGAGGVVQERALAVVGQDAGMQGGTFHANREALHAGSMAFPEGTEDFPPWALPVLVVFWAVVMVFLIAQMWCLFLKAGWPGWACLIPIYNAYVMLKIAGKPGWWLLLMLVPLVNFVIAVIIPFSIAVRFGKGAGFGLGLLFFPWLFYAILAFGSAQYQPIDGSF